MFGIFILYTIVNLLVNYVRYIHSQFAIFAVSSDCTEVNKNIRK